MKMKNCAFCGEGDDAGTVQLCDNCDAAFHADAPCDRAVLGKPFEMTGEDILCALCNDKVKGAKVKTTDAAVAKSNAVETKESAGVTRWPAARA